MELETAGRMKFVYLANHWPGSFGNFADDKNPGVFSARVLGKLSCEMSYMAANYVADSDNHPFLGLDAKTDKLWCWSTALGLHGTVIKHNVDAGGWIETGVGTGGDE